MKFQILIPTDFSVLSKAAVKYAMKLSLSIPSHIELLHIVESFPLTATRKESYFQRRITLAKKDAKELREELEKDGFPSNFTLHVVHGNPFHQALLEYVKSKNTDLIVMGTRGGDARKKQLLGSHVTSAMEHCPCPVLTVPVDSPFHSIQHLVYATDLTEIHQEMYVLTAFAQYFDAYIHVLHIFPEKLTWNLFDAEKISRDLSIEHQYKKISFYALMEDDVLSGIEQYLKDKPIDLLAQFTHQRNFFQRFVEYSVSKESIIHNSLPIITFKKIFQEGFQLSYPEMNFPLKKSAINKKLKNKHQD